MPVCIYHIQDCLTLPACIGVPLNDRVLLMTLYIFLASFCSKFPSTFSRGYHEKALSLPLTKIDNQYLCFLLIQLLITPLATFADMPKAG